MYDFGLSGPYPYITMEFVPGKDLWTLIRDEGRIKPARALPILRQIARGCSAIHELGIIHRDLKSQNVIVDENGAVAIVDFGLARWNLGSGFTLDSIILGTPQYMSPEQASGKVVDARTDIYSIGIIAFEALTGQLPFTGDSPIAVAMKQINDPVPDLLARYADVSGRPSGRRDEGASEGPGEALRDGGGPRGRARERRARPDAARRVGCAVPPARTR